MDLPLLLSGFSSLVTAFVIASVWATRRPAADLNGGEADALLLEVSAGSVDERTSR